MFVDKFCEGYMDVQCNEMNIILNKFISHDEVSHAISKLKKKSPGIDGLPAELIVAGKYILADHLVHIYNYILECGEYPSQWAEGVRVAIPKDGGSDVRPLTINPILGKLFEIIINNRMQFIEDAFNTGDVFNGGFVKNSMTTDNMFILLGCIQKQLLTGNKLYVAFVDFKKAFNMVNRDILFMKLIKSGLHGKVVKVLRSMYKQTKARAKINGVLYNWIHDYVGMNQGGPNSPHLFRKFLSDLGDYLEISNGIVLNDNTILVHLLWADDLVLLSDTESGLQRQLNGLFNFCKDCHMIVNETKTKIVLYGRVNQEDVNLTFNGKKLEIVDKYKYLGMLFNSTKCARSSVFKEACVHIGVKATRAMFKVTKDMHSVGNTPPIVTLKLFNSLVMPILEYGSEVLYCGKEIIPLEKVHLKQLKMMLGVNNNTSHLAIYGETGRVPLLVRQKQKVIKYWARILSLGDQSLVRLVYNLLLSLDHSGFKTWVTHVRNLLDEVNFSYAFSDQICNASSSSEIRTKVYELYVINWKKGICDVTLNPKLRSYCTYKQGFYMESYLKQIGDFKLRKILTRFRLSCHNLAIEKGRHCKPKLPVEKRICEYCQDNAVENESHFLMECSLYNDLRRDLFSIRNDFRLHENNFISILSCNVTSFHLAKCLDKMFKRRRDTTKS
jgi:hypothetical protein